MLHPKLEAKLEQKLILTPTLQQAIKLLQLNRIELMDLIKDEVEQNPVLEETYSQITTEQELESKRKEIEKIDFDSYFQDLYEQVPIKDFYYTSEEMPAIDNIPCPSMGLQDYLIWQLNLLDIPVDLKKAITCLIDNLNNDGYLTEPLENLVCGEFNFDILEKAKTILMNFDPLGVGAENIKECLVVQAQTQILKDAIEFGWDEILKKDNEGLKAKLNITDDEIFSILNALKYLDPYPGRRLSKKDVVYIEPDVFVFKKGKTFDVIVNEDGLPKLKLSKFYLRLHRDPNLMSDKGTKDYIEAKIQSALWLLKSIEQRKRTLTNVAKAIVKFQSEAVEKGLEFLKPLLLKNISEEVGIHESTVSRIVSNKYILTPAGAFLMRHFFIAGIKTVSGELKTAEEIKKAIFEIIEKENKKRPFKDSQISEMLYRNYRIFLARRTVAKYREEINIPCYKERKER